MNEFHRVFVHTARVGDKDVELTVEEFYAPGNLMQPVRFKITGPNGLESNSLEGMLTLLEDGPSKSLPEEPTSGRRPTAFPTNGTPPDAHLPPSNTDGSREARPSGIIEDAFDAMGSRSTLEQTEDQWPPQVYANQKTQRFVRVGETDVEISECWYWPQEKGKGRHWFEAPNGIKTATYREMCKRLGGRPKPRLPEDEHPPAPEEPVREVAHTTAPETGSPRVAENAFDLMDGSGDAETSQEPQNWEPFDPSNPLQTYPWALDERDPEELSQDELTMQLIWDVERIRELQPDLYEAALDSVKRQEYLDRKESKEKLAADLAPRCQYIKADGEACGAPAVKKRRFCHFHIRTSDERKKKKTEVQLPVLEDDLAIQMAVTNVCRGVLKGSLEPKCASTLLYGLQVASVAVRNLRQGSRARE